MDLTKEEILDIEMAGDIHVIRFQRGRIRDEREVLRALETLNQEAGAERDARLVVDLAQIEYLSSAGLGYLVGLLKKLRLGGGNLRLCGLRPSIFELFEVMRLTQIFDIESSADAAIAALQD